jgi:hypothetical protein
MRTSTTARLSVPWRKHKWASRRGVQVERSNVPSLQYVEITFVSQQQTHVASEYIPSHIFDAPEFTVTSSNFRTTQSYYVSARCQSVPIHHLYPRPLSTKALHYIYSRPLRIVTKLDFQREGGATRVVVTKEEDVERIDCPHTAVLVTISVRGRCTTNK